MTRIHLCILALLFTTNVVVFAVGGKLFWCAPVFWFARDFHNQWLTFSGGEMTAWLVWAWFFCGSAKVCIASWQSMIQGQDPNIFKAFVMTLFAPAMDFHACKECCPKADEK